MVPGAPRAATTSGTSKCSMMASESVGIPTCMHENTKFSLSHILDAYFKVGERYFVRVGTKNTSARIPRSSEYGTAVLSSSRDLDN